MRKIVVQFVYMKYVPQNMKKILSLASLFFVAGFLGAFFGNEIKNTKIAKNIKKDLGIKSDDSKSVMQVDGKSCLQQQEENDDSTLFVGCNGFF